MSLNPYKQLVALVPGPPVNVGEIIGTGSDGVLVRLVGGGVVHAMGSGEIGAQVYIKSSTVTGPAPELIGVDILI